MTQGSKNKILMALLGGVAFMNPIIASAQNADDVVVMRRVIAPPKTSNAPVPTDPDVIGPVPGSNLSSYYWVVSGWFTLPDDTCSSQAVQERYRGCVRRGEAAAEENCPQPAPETERIVEEYKGCEYEWVSSPSGDWASSCSSSTTRPLSAICVREDGVTVSDEFCKDSGARPVSQTGSNFEGCTYSFSVSEFGDWEDNCSTNTVRRRTVNCIRSDGASVGLQSCGTPVPASTENGENLSGCRYNWRSGDWSQYDSTCSVNATRTRENTCQRSDELIVDNSLCDPATEPATSESMEILSGCGYEWVAGEFGEWSSTCSATARRTRDVTCMRSDNTPVSSEFCPGDGPETSEVSDVATSCTYEWEAQAWSLEQACGANVPRSRTVVCKRSDGRTANDSFCTGEKPETSGTITDYSACTFNWQPNDWGAWSSTCSATATRTRTASCFRSDGTPADESECAGKPLPSLTDTQPVYTGCERVWTTGTWSNYNSTCSSTATRSRSVGCNEIRPSGAVPVALGFCDPATRPEATETTGVYTGCVNTWIVGNWGWNGVTNAWSNTCSFTAQQTRTVQCQATVQGTGEKVFVADNLCTAAKPATTQTQGQFSSCQRYWFVGNWNPPSSTCSMNATQTRTVQCRRIDGQDTVVPDTECNSLGSRPASNQTVVNITDCTGILVNGNFDADSNGTGWNLNGSSISTTRSVTAPNSLAVVSQNVVGSGPVSQSFSMTPGLQYRITFKYRSLNATPSVRYSVTGFTGPQHRTVNANMNNWQEVSIILTSAASTGSIAFTGWDNLNVGNFVYIDDVVINVAN